ncbi:MAG: hypothetical protein ABJL72_11665 [Roseobacter sp.]
MTKMRASLLACQVSALEQAPVATELRQEPPRYIPVRSYCRSSGRCYREGGFFVSGQIYSVDVNAKLRGDVEKQCMLSQSYSSVKVKRCTSGLHPPNDAGNSNRMPPLSENTCVTKDTQGQWVIIDPM